MNNRKLLPLFLCLTLAFILLLPMLSACNESADEQGATEQTTSADPDTSTTDSTAQPGESGTQSGGETNPEQGTEQTTEPGTEQDSEHSTEAETEPPIEEVKAAMPVLRIETTDGGDVTSKDYYKTCTITLENCSEPMQFEDVSASIRVRGNSTAGTEKKPFRIKFDKKRNVLGLNDGAKCKSWCLMADYFDYSLMRNSLSFRMAGVLLDGYSFASDCTWVEVYVNGDYRGVYLLCEQTQINSHRVDIYEKADDETSVEIGYLMVGQGGRTDEPNTISINFGGMPVTDLNGDVNGFGGGNFSLSSGDYTQEQIDYCAKYVGNIARLCYYAIVDNTYFDLDANGDLIPKTDFVGTTAREKQIETIAAHVDIESAVRIYMTDEIVKNLDSGTYNMYIDLSPDGDKKLTFGPPWDYDFALANTKYDSTHSTKGMYAANFSYSDGVRVNPWFVMFCQADWFREMCEPIWMEQRDELFAICETILADAAQYQDAFDRNFERWRILGTMNQGHQANDVYGFDSHEDAAYFVYNWLYKRLVYLDTVWGDRVIEVPEENKEFSILDFSVADRSDLFEDYNNCGGSYRANEYFRLKVTEAHDPYVHIRYENGGANLDADDYSVIEVTYRVPTTNRHEGDYTAEIFLCAGNYTHPVGGVSVHFDLIADGEWHTACVELPAEYWSGKVHQIRLDFFGGCERGDVFDLRSIVLTN